MKLASRWSWLFETLSSQLWFRATLFSLLAIATALVALLLDPLIPESWPSLVGADAVDGILNILASSMLTVTVFSLTTMVSAYSTASSNITPRATRLLLEDTTSQNAISTFLGAFLFSLVGVIALSTGLYGSSGRIVLFTVTLLVILLIVVTLLRWISHLSTLGQVGDTIGRVERAVSEALDERVANPYLGGVPPDERRPPSALPVRGAAIGYVVHIDMAALERAAGRAGTVRVAALPGSFVDLRTPLAWIDSGDPQVLRQVGGAFTIASARKYPQDPRFGLVVLAEIASRALSPAVNDPGTAIAVIGTGVRILDRWHAPGERKVEREVLFPHVQVPPLSTDDMFDDLFAPIARDGAPIVEVGVRLQKALAALASGAGEARRRAARRQSVLALEHAQRALALESERRRVVELAGRIEEARPAVVSAGTS